MSRCGGATWSEERGAREEGTRQGSEGAGAGGQIGAKRAAHRRQYHQSQKEWQSARGKKTRRHRDTKRQGPRAGPPVRNWGPTTRSTRSTQGQKESHHADKGIGWWEAKPRAQNSHHKTQTEQLKELTTAEGTGTSREMHAKRQGEQSKNIPSQPHDQRRTRHQTQTTRLRGCPKEHQQHRAMKHKPNSRANEKWIDEGLP